MKQVLVLVLAVIAATSVMSAAPKPVSAAIEVRSEATTNRFPQGVQFSVFLGSDGNITSARIRARILDRPTTFVRATCTAGTAANCTATLGNTESSYLVPGAEIFYSWEIEDATGAKLETPEQKVVYQDDRFQWQSVSEGNITVFYYFGSEEGPRAAMRATRETMDRLAVLEGATVDFPIKVWLYQTAADMQPAVASRAGRGPNSSVRTLGEVGAADTALVSRDVDFLNIVRHEIAHIVTGQATKAHINFPSWINEGISVYSQREVLPDEKQAMDQAIRRNELLPVPSLSSFQGAADTVSLFYGQAGSVIKFMIETYGDQKFAAWIAAIRTDTLDNATKTAYGMDLLAIENAWRKSLGVAEVAGGSGSGGGSNPSSIPTLAPLGSNPPPSTGGQATPSAGGTSAPSAPSNNTDTLEEDDGGSSPILPIAVGALLVLGFAAGVGFMLLKKRGQAAPPPSAP